MADKGSADPNLALSRAASALNSGAIHLLRSLTAVDRRAGLTRARLSALSVLVFGGSRTLGELASAEGVAGPTMTRIVDGLIGEGLAERQPHPSDGRAVTIAATAAGETLMRAAQQRRIQVIVTALDSLPAEQRRRLVSASGLLDQVAAAIRNQEGLASGRPAGQAGALGYELQGGHRQPVGLSTPARVRGHAPIAQWIERLPPKQ